MVQIAPEVLRLFRRYTHTSPFAVASTALERWGTSRPTPVQLCSRLAAAVQTLKWRGALRLQRLQLLALCGCWRCGRCCTLWCSTCTSLSLTWHSISNTGNCFYSFNSLFFLLPHSCWTTCPWVKHTVLNFWEHGKYNNVGSVCQQCRHQILRHLRGLTILFWPQLGPKSENRAEPELSWPFWRGRGYWPLPSRQVARLGVRVPPWTCTVEELILRDQRNLMSRSSSRLTSQHNLANTGNEQTNAVISVHKGVLQNMVSLGTKDNGWQHHNWACHMWDKEILPPNQKTCPLARDTNAND